MACILASLSLATSSLIVDGSHMQLCAALTVWTAVAHILGSHSADNWFGSTCRETYLSEFIPRGDYWSYTVQWALYYTCDVCHVRTLVWQSTARAFSRTHRHIRWAIFFGRCSDPGLAKYCQSIQSLLIYNEQIMTQVITQRDSLEALAGFVVRCALYYTCDVRTLVWRSTVRAFSRTHRRIRWAIYYGRCSDPGLARYCQSIQSLLLQQSC